MKNPIEIKDLLYVLDDMFPPIEMIPGMSEEVYNAIGQANAMRDSLIAMIVGMSLSNSLTADSIRDLTEVLKKQYGKPKVN